MRTLLAPALTLALALAGCSSPGDEPPGPHPAPAYRLTVDCPRPDSVPKVTVAKLNRLVAGADLPAWQAADIGASARLSDGRLVWLFGDTVRTKAYSPDMVGNSMLITSGTCITQLMAKGDGPVIPDPAPGVVLWPMSVVVLPPSSTTTSADWVRDGVVVLAARTRRGGGSGGALDFTYLGSSAAVFAVPSHGAPQLEKVMELTPDDDSLYQVNWGAAAIVRGPWLYVYGTRQVAHQFGRELHVARAPVTDPADRSGWRFWDGGRWQRDPDRSAATLPAQGGVSQTLSVDVVEGVFVAVSKRDGDLGDFVYTWTSSGPVGPWTARQGLSAPAGYDTGELQYAPLAHPEIELPDGRMLVSISRNTTDISKLLTDPAGGRPVFAEVDRP